MYDLLKKLNTLVSAQVNDVVSRLPSLERKPDLNRQVTELRQQVAAALEHEDQLRAQVSALQTEIAGLDARVDAAIKADQESTARGLLEEVQRLQKRLALAESDLRQHQASAADLIIKVNELESAVGDLKASQGSAPASPSNASAPIDMSFVDAPKGSITDFMPPMEEKPAPVELPKPAETAAPSDKPKLKNQPEEVMPERKPWEPPRTYKEAAEIARDDAKAKSERANTGVEQVGGLLRDIQARVTQRMGDLDRMLQEGGLTGEDPAATPAPAAPSDKPKPKADDDLSDRLSRLTKPD